MILLEQVIFSGIKYTKKSWTTNHPKW